MNKKLIALCALAAPIGMSSVVSAQQDLGDALFKALQSPHTKGRILAAVDADKAIDTKGDPLVVAEL